ncbi:uncharacterized protein LOC116427670 isoform X2 [Nomia melanderi]|uniref:uncharacterized protein LOC116427670 isoform X2 n=1 Tax=Nomia melanderi TaxID=2448451 RepID=UPI0013045371|nr:uncharacterized protein LOC116427670 isoform X2 [Nomia melanderi]
MKSFKAPKDPETRQKWQDAIGIENYAVTDDTYVCSKHFHKDDIITHWASGVPPYVITIKYKKCRLRPGAVPGRNYHEENEEITQEHSDDSDGNYSPFKLRKTDALEEKEKDFVIPRAEEKLEINCYEKHRIIPLHYKYTREFHDHNYMPNVKSLVKEETLENMSHTNNGLHKESVEKNFKQIKRNKTVHLNEDAGTFVMDVKTEPSFNDEEKSQHQTPKEDSHLNSSKKALESSSKVSNTSEEGDMLVQFWEHKIIEEEPLDNNFKEKENLSIENQMSNNYNQSDACCTTYNDNEENEMLFEDLLEICTEVLLPRGWSCLVTSTGHATTIVYMYMGMTKSGMPFTEKQVFIKSDMTLRCVAVNREINPLTHNLIREGKHLRVQNLLDIEELIDDFDQRMICQGIYNTEDLQEVTDIKVVYKDGVKWRHILCPLIMNNGSLRCTRCITLSHRLQRRSKIRHPLSYNLSTFTKNEQRLHVIRQKYKRTKKQVRKYEFIKESKK